MPRIIYKAIQDEGFWNRDKDILHIDRGGGERRMWVYDIGRNKKVLGFKKSWKETCIQRKIVVTVLNSGIWHGEKVNLVTLMVNQLMTNVENLNLKKTKK